MALTVGSELAAWREENKTIVYTSEFLIDKKWTQILSNITFIED